MAPWRFEGANTSEQQIWGRSGGVSSLFGGRCCRGRRRGGARCRRGAASGCGRGGRSGSRLRLRRRIDPAGVNPAAKRLGHLGIDLGAKPGQAAKGRLYVTAGATKAVVEIEMPERGVDIIQPHQPHHATAKPYAFRVSRRAVDRLRRFGEFVGLTLTILGRIGWLSRVGGGGFTRLILGTAVTTLGQRASKAYQQYKNRAGEVAQNQILELRHPSTHKFPD